MIAGSTDRTRICASALFADNRFEITGVITPTPKPQGREGVVQPNPIHTFAIAHDVPLVIVETSITQGLEEQVHRMIEQPDFLLVVDFGYIVPNWLLSWPKLAPLNVHPSALPSYRGSSPGQFVLIAGETQSAVTIMVMDELLDHGPIITSIPFAVDQDWTVADYYQHAFALVRESLAETIARFAETPDTTRQPDTSPTVTARQLRRSDGYIPCHILRELLCLPESVTPTMSDQQILLEKLGLPPTSENIYNLWRGTHPWPGIWTTLPIKGKETRVKILSMKREGTTISVTTIQREGKNPEPTSHLTDLLAL